MPMRIALVAGETSGDVLGAGLMQELRRLVPDVEFRGVAGPRMRAAGCQAIARAEDLEVFGITEILKHVPSLWRLRRRLVADFGDWRPDAFVGVDFKEFNLVLAAKLHRLGMRTVQYVSPQVWAWRQGRVKRVARHCDLLLCLLPFETAFYERHAVTARFVGHPLADEIALQADRAGARAALGIGADERLVALLPGSRMAEVSRLGADFLDAAHWLAAREPGLRFIAPMATPALRAEFLRIGADAAGVRLLDGQARLALQAADVALVASGTATLEALLCRCPMVAAYRVDAMTARLLRWFRLIKVAHFSLPNLLAGEALVPEFAQDAVQPAALGAALAALLADAPRRMWLQQRFAAIHQELRRDASRLAAESVLALVRG